MIIRRALSSERGFLGFLDFGFGLASLLLLLPSLSDQRSGVIEKTMVVGLSECLDGFVDGFLRGGGRSKEVPRKEDLRASIPCNTRLWDNFLAELFVSPAE